MQLYTACRETVLASNSCLCALQVSQAQKYSLYFWESFVHQVLNPLFTWGYPRFQPSLQDCWKSPTGLPIRAARQQREQREAADGKCCSEAAHLPEPGVSDSQDRSLQTCSALPRSNGCAATRPELTDTSTPRGLVSFTPVASRGQEHKAHFCHPCS